MFTTNSIVKISLLITVVLSKETERTTIFKYPIGSLNILVPFKRKFTEDNIIKCLSKRPMTLYELKATTGGSHMTIWRLVTSLMNNGIVSRCNRCKPEKPLWEYFLLNTNTIITTTIDTKEKKKRKLSDLEL